MDVKFYENKVNLNWKAVLKSIIDVSKASCLSLYIYQIDLMHLYPYSMFCPFENAASAASSLCAL